MGYDTVCLATRPLAELYRRAFNEGRVVLTRNHRVKHGSLIRVVYVESGVLEEQLRQLVRELRLSAEEMFSRCDRCNVPVEPIELPPDQRQGFSVRGVDLVFRGTCRDCRQ